MVTGLQPAGTGRIALHQVDDLFIFYGLGFLACFGLLGWMTYRAWRRREALGLNEMEQLVTREELVRCFGLAALGGFCTIMAIILPDHLAGMSGLFYGLIGVIEYFIGRHYGEQREATRQRMLDRGEWPME